MDTKKKKFLNDGIENLSTGLGSAKDSKTYNDFAEVTLTQADMENAYRYDWIFPKAVDIPAKDMTKKWLNFSGKNTQHITDNYKALNVKKIVRTALVYKALYGISYIVIESEGRTLKRNLDPGDKVKQLHVFHKFTFEEMPDDVHSSRIYTMHQNEFGDSILFKIKESILNLLTSLDIPASLLHKADMDFLSIKGLANALAKCKKDKDCKDAEAKILKRVQTMYEQLSTFKIGIKDTEEEFQNFTKNLTGYDKLQNIYMTVVAGAADIPATRFFGISPSGMNSTGQGDEGNYYDSLSATQDELIEPFLELLNDVLFTSHSINPKDFSFSFAPIKDPTPKELIDVEEKKANIIAKFIDELDPQTIAEAVSRLSVFEGIKVVINEQEEE